MASAGPALTEASISGNQERPIEADATSDYASDGDTITSDLTSVSSSVFNYQYENGRRYHAYRAGKYILPNDEKEQDRLDLMHHVFRLALDGDLCYSKLDSPLNILDVGTGKRRSHASISTLKLHLQVDQGQVYGR